MMSRKKVLLVVTILLIAVLACGSETTGTVVETRETGPTATSATVTTYNPGDVIDVGDHTITLNEYSFSVNLVTANFTIENTSNEEMTISTMLNFSARNSEGERLSEDIFDCSPSLGGTIYPGERIRGNVCFKNADNGSRIYYEASLFGRGAIIWELNE